MNDGQHGNGSISFRFSTQRAGTLATLSLLVIIVDIVAVLVFVGLTFFLEYVPTIVRLGMIAVILMIAVPTVLYVRHRRVILTPALRDGSLANAEIQMGTHGLSIGTPDSQQTYSWRDLAEPQADTEIGLIPSQSLVGAKALILSAQGLPEKLPMALRRRIGKAAMNSPWRPVEVDSVTVLPLRFVKGPVPDLIRTAKQLHRQAQHER